MSWEWEVLGAVVRSLFLLAPFMSVAQDFTFVGDSLVEAREFALAGSCRAMLVSFPAQLFLAILARASSTQCQNVKWLTIALFAFGCVIIAVGLFNIPTRWFRGTIVPFVWLIVFTGLGVIAQIFGLSRAVQLVCG
jgi:hypothetical protein